MERHPNWYSVIQYQPDVLRGERINVGLIFHNPETGTLLFKMLDDENIKVRSFLADSSSQRVYRAHKDYVEHLVNHVNDNALNIIGDIQAPSTLSETFLSELHDLMPDSLRLSEPTFTLTGDSQRLFDVIIRQYVGHQFLQSEDKPTTTKAYVKNYFAEKKWLGTLIKPNVHIHPVKEIPTLNLRVDFVFKNGVWNLIQTLPATDERLSDWFSKTHMILEYEQASKLYVMYDSKSTQDSQSMKQTLKFLRRFDVTDVAIGSRSFLEVCDKIESEAKDISKEPELIAL